MARYNGAMRSTSNMRNHGFTIVELVVVIVVISIIASISIASYSGIQARAEKVRTVSTVRSYMQALSLYKISENKYPLADTYGASGSYSACLGEGYTERQNINGDNLPDCRWGSWGESVKIPAFDAELNKYARVSASVNSRVIGGGSDGAMGMYYAYYPDATLNGNTQRDWLIFVVMDNNCGMVVPQVGTWPAYTTKNNELVSESFGTGGLCHVPLE